MFVEQGFLHDLLFFDWSRIALFDDVEIALSFIQNSFLDILSRHAPIHKFRIKGRDNPWFTAELSYLLHERNVAWTKARKSDAKDDWLLFRQLRNQFTYLLREAKAESNLSQTTKNLNDPKKGHTMPSPTLFRTLFLGILGQPELHLAS